MELFPRISNKMADEGRETCQIFTRQVQTEEKPGTTTTSKPKGSLFHACEMWTDDFYRNIHTDSGINQMKSAIYALDREKYSLQKLTH